MTPPPDSATPTPPKGTGGTVNITGNQPNAGFGQAAVQGVSTADDTIGVAGSSGSNDGVWGQSQSGNGLDGYSATGSGVNAFSTSGSAVKAVSAQSNGIWASGKPAGYFQGDVTVTGTETVGNITTSGTVTAASLTTSGNVTANDVIITGADLAEDFRVDGEVEPGTVMVINGDGSLGQNIQEYDKRVAGVVSGAGDYRPGIVLDRRAETSVRLGQGRISLALAGKVFCKVDAGYAPIEIGDLLTTSPTPGYAMKAGDHHRAFGAVIGKALAPLGSGTSIIPILVALQ